MSKIKNFCFLVVVLVAVLVTFGVTRYTGQSCEEKKKSIIQNAPIIKANVSYHLPTNLKPLNYILKLKPFMRPDQFYFEGSVKITVICNEPTDVIELNVNQLEIPNQQITVNRDDQSKKFNVSKVEIEGQILKIKLNENLNKNTNYTIFIPFKGNLTTSLVGFYRSSYFNFETNETNYLATTHFEATDARRAFPCYDEPELKATFDIEIEHWKNLTAISNMDAFERIDDQNSDWTVTKFERTVKMSTYLIAFAVGDFSFTEKDKSNKPNVRIVTRPSEKEHAKVASEITPKILAHYEDYFKVKFPLSKIDMLAAPDFEAGAMENWGLIIYREALVLYDEKVDTVIQLYRVISTIAHELAHQWSGNLVTMKWWDDLWLNEGFASYISYEGVNAVKPEYNVWDLLVISELHDVLELDSLKSSHPISVKVDDPSEIRGLFDRISYAKGCSIINMMTYIIGKEAFKKGMNSYLTEFAYSNAKQDDLWNHLQKANDEINKNATEKLNVKEIMDSWTLKEGYPLVTITRFQNSTKVRFAQKRFLKNSNDTKKLISEQYEVPITFTTKTEQNWEPKTRLWLHKQKEGESFVEIKDLGIAQDDWIIANLKQTGYYRVNYDEQNWNLLIQQLNTDHTKIDRINRVQILNDLFSLAENGIVKYSLALNALKYLDKEQDDLIWISYDRPLNYINRMLNGAAIYGHWKRFVQKLIEKAYKSLDLNSKDTNLQASYKKNSLVDSACAFDLKECVENSKKLFNEFVNNATQIAPGIRSTVFCKAVQHGDESEWNLLYARYLSEQNSNERNRIISALACTRVSWLLKQYLRIAFDENSGFKRQDSLSAFQAVAFRSQGREIAFDFMRENWDLILRTNGYQMSFSRLVKSFDTFNTEFKLKQYQDFYRSIGTRVGTANRGFLQTIDKIKSNIEWMQNYESEIYKFLTNQS